LILIQEPVSRIGAADLPRNPLTQRAMTATLHLSAWGGARLDKQVTREVLSARQARPDAGRFEKRLIPLEALEGVTRAHTSARARHHALTLPWGEGSTRILSAALFLDHAQAMAEERAKCERAYRAFCSDYPGLLASAPGRLGSMYNPADFPDPARIGEKFGFKIVIMPVPDGDDFRVSLGSEIESEIRASIEATVRDQYGDAQRVVWGRVLDIVKHFAETMATDGKKFQDTTVTKLHDIATLAPKLSLVPDPLLQEICDGILAITQDIDAAALRVSKAIRTKAATDAKATVERIEARLRGAFVA
jgi:hypothetical protein